jgi:tripartite-type tricarboxylate transporter receptor subunit TctC
MPAPALLRPAMRIIVLTAALIAFSDAGAEPYPKAGPIRLIVPQQVGSSSDLVSRVMAQKLSEALRQQIVVDNRPGAGGTIAMETGSRATPDGYTLIAAATGPVAIAPHAYRKLDYRPIDDFTAVSLFATTQNMLIVNGKLGIQSVRDLIERARARPGQLNLASGGSGTQSHLAGVLFAEAANVKIVHVPYRGAGSSVAAIISGEAQLMFPPASAAINQVREGLLKGLAVTGEDRLSAIPELPTMQEAGLPDYVSTGWVGLMAPKGVPKGVIDTLSRALTEAAKDPRTIAALDRLGAQASTSSSDRFASTMRSEFAKYGKAVKAAGLSIE